MLQTETSRNMDAALPVAIAALGSFIAGEMLVLTFPQHQRFSRDLPGGPQKVHLRPTPRVGGIGIYLSVLVATVLLGGSQTAATLRIVVLAGIPALLIGLLEDVTKHVGVRARLTATCFSGVLACLISGVAVSSVRIPGLDVPLSYWPVAVAFTAFAISGLANAVNIIDGFNGLASGVTAIALAAIAVIAWNVGDAVLAQCCLVLIAAVAGFWLVNFPWGKLFLGDGGAYFAGFALGWIAVLLPMRNPSVSPWASLLVCAYPVIEVLYSVVRRLHGRRSPGSADCAHLHSLVATRIVQRHLGRLDPALQNSATSVLMWMCAAIPAFLAVTFHAQTLWLAVSAFGCVVLYHWLYRHVARR